MAMGDVLGRLSVVLGLDTAAFETSSRRAGKTTADMGDKFEQMGGRVGTATKALVGLGAAIAGSQLLGQIKDMAVAGLEFAGSLGEQAQQLGVTTGELQKFRYIATQVGIDQDVMDKGLAKLSITLGDLANGAKAPAAALQRLGFDQQKIAEISKMTAGEALPVLADGFAKLKSPTEAASIAADLFGSKMGGKFLTLMMGGREQIDAMTTSFERLGLEITTGEIAKADDALDELGKKQQELKQRQGKIAAQNSEGILEGVAAWDEFKLRAVIALGTVNSELKSYDTAQAKFIKKLEELDQRLGLPTPDTLAKSLGEGFDRAQANVRSFGDAIGDAIKAHSLLGKAAADLAKNVLGSLKGIATAAETWLRNKLGAVLNWLKGELDAAGNWFYRLYDRTVGHSYIPDMVDGIAFEMQRLDTVMVKPIKNATEAAAEAFRQFQGDVQGLMGNLFPDSREIADFRTQLGLLDRAIASGGKGTGFNADQLRAGRQRLIGGASADVLANVPLPLADQLARFGQVDLGDTSALTAALDRIGTAANDNAQGIGLANVQIAKSFKDMADATLGTLDRLAGAIKGGGFLDILSSVIGLGLQLGSIGLFGKGIQTNINKAGVPGFANGTSFAPGGLALVGERGPELVNLPRGSQVIPNRALGQGGGAMRVEVVPSPYFDVRVQQNIDGRAPGLVAAGARAGEARSAFRLSRRVA